MSVARSLRVSALSSATIAIAACAAVTPSLRAANLLGNPGFESPPSTSSVDSTIASWTIVDDAQRANFQNHTPGGSRSVWLKTFDPLGGGVQQDVGITGGANYLLSSFDYFEASFPNTEAVVYMQVSWLDAGSNQIGSPNRLEILPTQITSNDTGKWLPFSLNTTAPASATTARVFFGWQNGGTVTGAQSAFVDDVVFDGPGTPPPPIGNDWVPNSSGDWNVASNWLSGSVPNAVDAKANFLGAITAAHTVYSDVPVVAGALKFQNANTYVIAGAGTLTLDVGTGNATIDVLSGSHKINLPLRLNDNTVATVAAGSTLSIADPLTLANGSTLTKAGTGTLEILSTVSTVSPAALSVTAGSANLRTDIGSGTTLQASGGTATAFATQRVASVQVSGSGTLAIDSAGAAKVVKTSALSVTGGGKVDVGDNGLIVQYSGASPVESIRSSIISAYNGGAFNGPGIGTSAPTAGRGIGYADSTQVGSPTSFLGENFSGAAVLVRYTLLGDTNLDGTVGFNDLLALAKVYNGTNQRWVNGDSDYDGDVDFADLLALAKNYNGTISAADAAAMGGQSFAADVALAQSLVPEPASLSLAGLAGAALLRRRR